MSKKSKQRDTDARLDAVYARLPRIACKGLCADSCGPIILSPLEADRAKRARSDRLAPSTHSDTDVRCRYLTPARRCSVYAVRPLICRVWGLVKRMSCPRGCVPDRWLTDREFVALATEIEAIRGNGPLLITTPQGPQALGDSFSRLHTSINAPTALPDDVVERESEHTRGLRALYGGQIVAVTPSAEPQWIKLERPTPKARE